jgi:hypothetical protein
VGWRKTAMPIAVPETGQTAMLEVATVNAASTIMLLLAIAAMYAGQGMRARR